MAELKSKLTVALPWCATHPDQFAVAFCGHCGRPICQACLTVTPVEPRCEQCRTTDPAPPGGVWRSGLLRDVVRQRWAIVFTASAVLFVLLLFCLPGLLRAKAPAEPGFIRGTSLQTPYVEKAFRLRTTGDLYAAANRMEKARQRYREALAACRAHLEGEKRAPVRMQVELGVARLQEKAGDPDGAMATCQKLISEAAAAPAAGVAHFYLGRTYEVTRKDSARALEHYRAALKYADATSTGPLHALEKVLEFDEDKDAGGKTLYGIAALTDTQTSATALRADIIESIRRITGKEPEPAVAGMPPGRAGTDEGAPQAEADDPLVIVRGT